MRRKTIEIITAVLLKENPLALIVTAIFLLTATAGSAQAQPISVNILCNTELTAEMLADLEGRGNILDIFDQIRSVHMRTIQREIPSIKALPYVVSVSPEVERYGGPVDTVDAEDFIDGWGTWDLDAVGVITDPRFNIREVPYDGTGVYVAVLDSGLLDSWRQYFPEERIATEYAICFGGGGMERGHISTQPNKWEHDQNSHGTHVTSTIIGYDFYGDPINGVAPMAKIIPVKVLNQNGFCWSSVAAAGILYVADLKEGPLAGHPVVINMSLGGPQLDAVEQAAINYAISKGVIIVASAGNRGEAGMGYPGAYPPVISVAASGWIWEWIPAPGGWPWWWGRDVMDPTNPDDFYICDFSSRQLPGQDLDVAAPGSWVVGPYQLQSGKTSYYYLGGTSMASPHVAGIVALMAQKYQGLTAAQAEGILEASAVPLAPGCRDVFSPWGSETPCWGANATGSGLADAVGALAATP